ncbi:MAG: hypothetical protein K9N06_01195 [Candidatus Cloacimonetes bacterium]|nr:hypothetical protein [Candidatus Cloacimonadota bacterium]
MFKIRSLVILLLIVSAFGCSINEQLAANLSKNRQSVKYVFDSEIVTEKKDVAVIIDPVLISDSSMKNVTEVTQQSGYVIPLLLINFWNYEYSCKLGENVIAEDLSHFFYYSLSQESLRSGVFFLNPDESFINRRYDLEVTVESLSIEGPYKYKGYAFISPYAYSYSMLERAGPAVARCKLHLSLKKGDEIVLTKEISSKQKTEFLKNTRTATSVQMQEKYALAMAEALAKAINRSVSEIITTVNEHIMLNETDLTTVKEITANELYAKQEAEIPAGVIKIPKEKLLAGYLYFHLDDGRIIDGKLVDINRKEVYVEKGRTLIVINKEMLVLIEDSNEQDVTERELARSDFYKIDYNAYNQFIYETKEAEIPAEKEEPVQGLLPGYLSFHLDDGRIIDGKLRKVTKKEISVEKGEVLITIKRNKVVKIEDINLVDVTEQELSRKDFKRINYNSYKDCIEIK